MGQDATSGPDPGAIGGVDAAAIPAVAAFERADSAFAAGSPLDVAAEGRLKVVAAMSDPTPESGRPCAVALSQATGDSVERQEPRALVRAIWPYCDGNRPAYMNTWPRIHDRDDQHWHVRGVARRHAVT